MNETIQRILAIRAWAARGDLNLVAECDLALRRAGYVESTAASAPLERAVPRKPRRAS